jgi:hypothetical protein
MHGWSNSNKEINMADRNEKRIEQDRQQYEQWRELSKEHWGHWRAWGSWFSWGSPVGLGLFFVLVAVTVAIVKFAITL